MKVGVYSASIPQEDHLDVLSKKEIFQLLDSSQSGLYHLFRRCSLAVLNCGSDLDDIEILEAQFKAFDIELVPTERGVKIALKNAPASAFVDGKIIKGISDHLYAVVRDILYVHNEILGNDRFNLESSLDITDSIFHICRNAGLLNVGKSPNMVVCWGGHSISHDEYVYTKKVGYQLGLRGLDICTGCGPGAMKGPMKGATIGHAEQRLPGGVYLGVTEPGIIGAESPNPIVNQLVIMPDIEKRLEAFLRVGHGVIVFPGGVGTMEEILYILGVLLHSANKEIPYPLIFTGPEGAADYFKTIDHFLKSVLGDKCASRYKIIIDDPDAVALELHRGIKTVTDYRKQTGDAFYYNWRLSIPEALQQPFLPTHENVKNHIQLTKALHTDSLIIELRKVFSAIVAGNVKEDSVKAIKEQGPFEISGDADLMKQIDGLLKIFVDQGRMKLPGTAYKPCYRIAKDKP